MNDSLPGASSFFSHVLVKKTLDFSLDVIPLGEVLWGKPAKQDFLLDRDFQLGVNLALKFLAKPKTVVLAGSKGIGKSCLGLVIVSTLLKKDCIVAYEYNNSRLLLIPSEDALRKFRASKNMSGFFHQHEFQMVDKVGVYEFDSRAWDLYRHLCFCQDDLLHVMDLSDQFEGRVETDHPLIVISSPTEKLKRTGEEGDADYVIYPPWGLEEIRRLNAAFPDGLKQEEDVLALKLKLFGGIPREIFNPESVEEAKSRLEMEIGEVSFDTWNAAFAASSYSKIPKLVGMFVAITAGTKPGKVCNVNFASDYIRQLVIRRHAQARRVDLMALLGATDSPRRMLTSLQGFLLEEHRELLSPAPL